MKYKLYLLLPCLTVALWGADVSGKWSGVIEVDDTSSGTKINTSVKAEFTQQTTAVSGKIGRKEDEEAEPIRNGKVQGNTVVFEVRSAETSGAMKFSLVVVGDNRIEGDMKGAVDTGPITGKVKLTREATP
jgi:hypothetical protein